MNKLLAVAIAILAIAAISSLSPVYAMGSKQEESASSDSAPPNAMAQDAGNSMMAATDPSKAVFDLSGLAPGVLPFSTEAAAQAIASRKRVVYFFAASWCPTCRETYRDLKANAEYIPDDLVIVVVDYDKSAALKTRYGVTYQHTFVTIGPMGEKLKAWSGTTSVSGIVQNASAMQEPE
ncbi:MAG: thioredoxin domain-containing protein [Spirochaetota bacterium]